MIWSWRLVSPVRHLSWLLETGGLLRLERYQHLIILTPCAFLERLDQEECEAL
jgi:hypothetical protein